MRRRTLLAKTAAFGSITALAGCLNEGGGDETEETTTDETTTEETTTDETSTERPELEATGQSIETSGTECGEENDASIEFGDTTTTITGQIRAPNPCHEATIGEVKAFGGVLQLNVDATETDAETCQSCIGTVEYTATLETNVPPQSAVVGHLDEEGEVTVVADEFNN